MRGILTFKTFTNAQDFEQWQKDNKNLVIIRITPVAIETKTDRKGCDDITSTKYGIMVIHKINYTRVKE